MIKTVFKKDNINLNDLQVSFLINKLTELYIFLGHF